MEVNIMPKYCVANFAKHKSSDIKGLQAEVNRTLGDPSQYKSNIRFDKSPSNIYFAKSNDWRASIKKVLTENNIKPRKDAVLFTTSIYGFSKEWEDDLLTKYDQTHVDEIKRSYFADCFKFEQSRGTCFSAVVHVDEEGNWHMHTATVPIIKHPTKEGQMSLSAKRIFGNKIHMSKEQDRFYEQCGKPYGMERGKCRIDTPEHRKHLTETEYKISQDKLKIAKAKEDIAKQIAEYTAKMNAVRKREEELTEDETDVQDRKDALKRRESLVAAQDDKARENMRMASETLSKANTASQKAAMQKAEAQAAEIKAEELIEQTKPCSMFRNVWNMVETELSKGNEQAQKTSKIMSLIRHQHLDAAMPTDSEAIAYMKQQATQRAHRRLLDLSDIQNTDGEYEYDL